MKRIKSLLCIFLVVTLIGTLFVGCNKQSKSEYLGTWKTSTGADAINYLIFDENGYWQVRLDYTPLRQAISDKPDLFTTFEHFIDGNVYPGLTYCEFEYVENTEYNNYTDTYVIDENGKLGYKDAIFPVYYTKQSDNTGYPSDAILAEAKAIFDKAMAAAKK